MHLIAAVDRNWAIGKDGRLLVRIPLDQKFFLEETKGKLLLMGRRTFEGLPGGRPLPGRRHLVLSADPAFFPEGAELCRSPEEALERLRGVPDEGIFLCGGEAVYRLFLPYCRSADVTRIDYSYDGDRFLPDLDRDPEWRLSAESEEETYFDLSFTFCRYERIAGGRSRS